MNALTRPMIIKPGYDSELTRLIKSFFIDFIPLIGLGLTLGLALGYFNAH